MPRKKKKENRIVLTRDDIKNPPPFIEGQEGLNDQQREFIRTLGFNDEDVVDYKSFLKYIEHLSHPLVSHPYITVKGREINLAWLRHYLKAKIDDMSEADKDYILDKKEEHETYKSRGTHHKVKAFSGYKFQDGSRKGIKDKSRIGVRVLLERRKVKLIELFARNFSVSEVQKIIFEKWKISATSGIIEQFQKTYLEEIKEAQEVYRNNIDDVRLSHRRARLDELSWAYNNLKGKYAATQGINYIKLALATLKQIKEETHGDLDIRISGKLQIDIEESINEHVKQQLTADLNIYSIIMARVAVRMSSDPTKIVNQLRNSFYSKHTTLGKDSNFKPEKNTGISRHPSDDEYVEFEEIEKKIKKEEEIDELKEREEEKAELAEELKGMDISESLKDLLRSQSNELKSQRLELEREGVERENKEKARRIEEASTVDVVGRIKDPELRESKRRALEEKDNMGLYKSAMNKVIRREREILKENREKVEEIVKKSDEAKETPKQRLQRILEEKRKEKEKSLEPPKKKKRVKRKSRKYRS